MITTRPVRDIARDLWRSTKDAQAGIFEPTIATGFQAIDDFARLPRSLCFLGALSGIGKSLFAANLVRIQVLAGRRVGFLVLEDSDIDLMFRIACALSQTNNILINRKDGLSGEALSAYFDALSTIAAWENLAVSQGVVTTKNVVEEARKTIDSIGCELLVIDHFHRIKRTSASELRDYNEAAEGLQSLANEKKIPIFCTAQFHRMKDDGDKYPRPNMTNVKGSSDLEQASRWFAIMDRPEHFDTINDREPDPVHKNHVYLRLQKVTSGGRVGIARLGIRPETSTLFSCRCGQGIFCSDVASSQDMALRAL